MRKKNAYFISVSQAISAVYPHTLDDVLQSLMSAGLIYRYKIGNDLIRIDSRARTRFELSSYLGEASEVTPNSFPKKKTKS